MLSRKAIATLTLCFAHACASTEKADAPEVKIVHFEGDTTDAPISGIIHLRWKIENGERLEILSEPAGTSIFSSTEMEGEHDVRTGTEDTTFKLLAFGIAGDIAVKRTRIDVDDELVRVRSFEAGATFVELGATVALSWITEGAGEARILDNGYEVFRTTTDVLQGTYLATISDREHRFTLEARGMEKTDARDITVKGDAPPRILAHQFRPHVFRVAAPPPSGVELSWNALGAGFELAGEGAVGARETRMLQLSHTTAVKLIARSASAAIERTAIAYAVEDEREPNDSTPQLLAHSGAAAELTGPTDVDLFQLSIPAGGAIFVETEDGGGGCAADTAVRLLGLGEEELARDNDGGAPLPSGLGGCSRLGPIANLPAGEYRIEVRGSAGPYTLIVQTLAPSCGNAVVETNEACDDGNNIGDDGCSAACVFEPIAAPGRTVIVDVGDHRAPARTIAIDAAEGDSITVHTDTGMSCELDLHLELLDASGRSLGEDTGFGCASIDPARDAFAGALSAGRYYLAIGNAGGGRGELVAVQLQITGRNP